MTPETQLRKVLIGLELGPQSFVGAVEAHQVLPGGEGEVCDQEDFDW
jgi:hypothetical protein